METALAIGTVYVAALNRSSTLTTLGEALHRDPYRAPPKAPVLHLKPANTWSRPGNPIVCPAGVTSLRMGGSLAMVIGVSSHRLEEADALDRVSEYLLANDVSIPYQSHYRPAIKERCRDGFLPLGHRTAAARVGPPDAIEVIVEVNGAIVSRTTGADLVRRSAQLLVAISQFITLEPGDLVLLGEPADPPVASPGDRVRISSEGLASLENPITRESGAPG